MDKCVLVCLYCISRDINTPFIFVKELEVEGQYNTAGHHYIEAGDWKAAVNMCRGNELWEDAFRVRLLTFFVFTGVFMLSC